MKLGKLRMLIVLEIIFTVWISTRTFGPLDTYPRVQQIEKSSDGKWMFEIYQRKLMPLNPLADAEIVFRVTDIEGNKVSEQRIWRTAWQAGFDRRRNFKVRFGKDVIIVNDFWVARKTNLKFEMCPLLECLEKPD